MNLLLLKTASPTEVPAALDPNQPIVREGIGIRVIFTATVGEHKLLYSSALKGLDKPEDLQNLNEASFTGTKTITGSSIRQGYWYWYVKLIPTYYESLIFLWVLFYVNRSNWLDKWSLGVLGNVNKTIVGFLPDRETGIVPNLEVVTLDESFALFQVHQECDL